MKKIFYLLLLTCFVFTTSCNNNKFEVIGKGVATIAKCCNTIQGQKCSVPAISTKEEEPGDGVQASAPLPNYIWDSKLMVW
jgi:predicted small secreted protein